MTTATLTGVRWSTASTICARQAVYAALGAPADPIPEAVQRRFMRGTRLGRMMAEEVAEDLRRRKGHVVHVEHEARWPLDDPVGVDHADMLNETEPEVIEVVSSKDAALPPRKPVQAAGYAIHRRVAKARILAVDPATNETAVYPVNVEELRPEVERIERQVVEALRGGDLPPRLGDEAKAHPGTWPCRECPHLRHCYDGWQPPPAGTLPDHLAEDVAELALLDEQISRAKQVAELVARRDELRARIEPYLEDGRDYIAAGVKLRRTTVPGRRSLRFADMEAAGWSLPPELAEFVAEGKPSARWTTRILEAR